MKTGTFRGTALLLVIGVFISGCGDLILRDTDSATEKTGKVAARVLLCPLTFCFSELGLAQNKRNEEQQLGYQRWFQTLTPEQQEREYDRQAYREAAAMRALGFALSSGGPMRSYAPVYQPPVMQPLPGYNLPQRQRFNCQSSQIGNQTMTNCQ
jgi:hypothetical protein